MNKVLNIRGNTLVDGITIEGNGKTVALSVVDGVFADLVEGKVPSDQLPSYVDDVIEVANYATLPSEGETGKIYVTLDTNNTYRWSGSAYINITNPHSRQHAITSATDHTSSATAGKLLKADANGLPVDSRIVDDGTNITIDAVTKIGDIDVAKTSSLVQALQVYSATASESAVLAFLKSKSAVNGTLAATDDDTVLLKIQGQGVNSSNARFIMAEIIARQNGASNVAGGDIEFWTASAGVAKALRAVLLANGNFGVNVAVPDEKIDVLGNIKAQQFKITPPTNAGAKCILYGRDLTFPVPYFTPNRDNTRIAFDIFPRGTATDMTANTGVAWVDICDSDIVADGINFECVRIGKLKNGIGHIGTANGGTGTVRNLAINLNGGNVGFGATDPTEKVDVVGNINLSGVIKVGTVDKSTGWDAAKTHADNASTAVHGATTVGYALLKLANPSAIRFLKVNADNTVTTRSAIDFKTDIEIRKLQAEIIATITLTNASPTGYFDITLPTEAETSWDSPTGKIILHTYQSSGGDFTGERQDRYEVVWVKSMRSPYLYVTSTRISDPFQTANSGLEFTISGGKIRVTANATGSGTWSINVHVKGQIVEHANWA